MKRKITLEDLQKLEACGPQQEIFSREWPDGAIINEKNYRRASVLGLNLPWLTTQILTYAGYRKYHKNCHKIYDLYFNHRITREEKEKRLVKEMLRAVRADSRKRL